MLKKIKTLQVFGFSILFVFLGIYILNTTETTIGKFVGYASIVFFGGLIVFATYRMINKAKTD